MVEETGDQKEDKLGLFEAELSEGMNKALDDFQRNYQEVLRTNQDWQKVYNK